MIVNFTFIGLMAPVFTIFNPDFSINTDRIPSYADYLAESGINGILVSATSGEGTSLSLQERKNITEAWAYAVKATRQHLMVQVGGCPFPDVLELARHAEDMGADSILTMPELYFKPKKPQELINYLKFVSAAAPKTPLLYYHNPGHTAVNIDMAQFLEESVGQIANLKGIKFTSNDLAAGYAALKAAGGRYSVFIGGDYLIEPAFALGFTSAIATSMNVFPRYSIGMLETIQKSDVEQAKEFQHNLTKVLNIMNKYGSKVATMKVAMNLFTPIHVGLARPPLENIKAFNLEEMKSSLAPFI